jgi:hypothetical protein
MPETMDLKEKNFFEARVIEYQNGGAVNRKQADREFRFGGRPAT